MRPREDRPVVLHQGVYKKTATLAEAVLLITSLTIGAGVFGIPFVAARVGLWFGIGYILVLGAVTLGLNLMMGEAIARTEESVQLPGLAGKYFGPWGKRLITVTFLFTGGGALLAYLIGAGQALAALFGYSPRWWTVLFWLVGTLFIAGGLQAVKRLERWIGSAVILMLAVLSLYLFGTASPEAGSAVGINWSELFLPYGVVLFALRAAPAIAEAEAVLPNQPAIFKKAVMLGTLIPTVLYALFAWAVVRVTGLSTTEIATVGLGAQLGAGMLIAGNVLAGVAMTGAFVGLGTALTESLRWDYQLPRFLSLFLVTGVPLLLWVAGVGSFIMVLEVVGGVFIGLEALIIIFIYFRVRQRGNAAPGRFKLAHPWLVTIPVAAVFGVLTAISLGRLFVD